MALAGREVRGRSLLLLCEASLAASVSALRGRPRFLASVVGRVAAPARCCRHFSLVAAETFRLPWAVVGMVDLVRVLAGVETSWEAASRRMERAVVGGVRWTSAGGKNQLKLGDFSCGSLLQLVQEDRFTEVVTTSKS